MHVFIEFNNGRYYIRVSPYAAGNPSAMHERGSPFPRSLKDEYDDPELALVALKELTQYYLCSHEKRHSKTKRGSKNEVES